MPYYEVNQYRTNFLVGLACLLFGIVGTSIVNIELRRHEEYLRTKLEEQRQRNEVRAIRLEQENRLRKLYAVQIGSVSLALRNFESN